MQLESIDTLKAEATAALVAADTAATLAEFEAAFDRFDALLPRIMSAARAEAARAVVESNRKAGADFWDAKKQRAGT